MPRRPDAKTLSNVQLTPAQYTAVQAEASRLDLDVSRYVRNLLAENVPEFVDEIPARGTYARRRQYIGLCIGDGDEVIAPAIYASAWLEEWHRDERGDEVPAVYKLAAPELATPKAFETLRELLDAMGEVAPFDQWRVDGEGD
jgi:hypothetical protein